MIKDRNSIIYQDSMVPENCFANISMTRPVVFRTTSRIIPYGISPQWAYPPVSRIADDYTNDIEPIYEKSISAIDIETQSDLSRYKDQIARKIAFEHPFTNLVGFLQTEPS